MSSRAIESTNATAALQSLVDRFKRVRRFSTTIADPLSAEDCAIQSMPDVSPTRWHLAHTTWFFETFVLKNFSGYSAFDKSFEYLFNSYYNSVGEQFPRHRRGQISRPGLAETLEYRDHVDTQLVKQFSTGAESDLQALVPVVELGLQHEQQHQELMLTDIKHVLGTNPLLPAYQEFDSGAESPPAAEMRWIQQPEGVFQIGHDAKGFAYDNESPRHSVYVAPFELASRCVTNGEYLQFVEDAGYQKPEHWLSMGWAQVQAEQWQKPMYWRLDGGTWKEFTLAGERELCMEEPACHLSYFEADAYARWAGLRLPTEFEWEIAASENLHIQGAFADQLLGDGLAVHPGVERGFAEEGFTAMLGNMWEWTSSQYSPYPGYAAPSGALGEYNGKFMCNQFVLRGGSCATSSDHIRATYRNFFPPDARWQFSGVRLAR